MCLAVPGQVQAAYEAHGTRMGKVNFGGVVKEVCLACVPEAAVGDYVLSTSGLPSVRLMSCPRCNRSNFSRKWVFSTRNCTRTPP